MSWAYFVGYFIGIAVMITSQIFLYFLFRNTLIRCIEIAIRRSNEKYTYEDISNIFDSNPDYYIKDKQIIDRKKRYKENGGINYKINKRLSNELYYLEKNKEKQENKGETKIKKEN